MPGSGANTSGGYTDSLVSSALRCDQQRVLERLKGGAAACCASPILTKTALPASVLEIQKARGCPLTAQQELLLPKAGIPESERIARVQQAVWTQSTNPTDPNARFSNYTRFVPQAPCPPPTAEQLNSTQPAAPMIGCQPSRFF